MATSHTSPKGRYTTGLPSFIETAEHAPQNVTSSQVGPARGPPDSRLKPQIERDQHQPIVHNSTRDSEIQSPQSYSNRREAALLADSLLPYQRPLPAKNSNDVAARLILIDPGTSSSSDHLSSILEDSQTERSSSTNSGSDRYEAGKSNVAASQSPREVRRVVSSESPESKSHDKQAWSTASQRYHTSTRDTTTPDTKNAAQRNGSRAPDVPRRNPERAGFSSPKDIIFRNNVHSSHAAPSVKEIRSTPRYDGMDLRAPRIDPPPIAFEEQEAIKTRSILSKSHVRSIDQPPDVRYENVEGVQLDTQPAAPQKQKGMSLPEIEARDVRQLPDQHDGRESRQSAGSNNTYQESFFRGSPLLSGANRQINSHTIPPRTTDEFHQSASIDMDSQIDNDMQSELLPKPPQVPLDDGVGSVTKSQPIHASHVARHSQSRTRTSFDAPATIPEDSREDLLEMADDKGEDLAEPPPIAMGKEFEERDSKMTRGIQTTKSLLSKMLR